MARRVRLDSKGIEELLRSPGVAAEVTSGASRVREVASGDAAVMRHRMPVRMASGFSDRARAIVTIAHPGGLGVQAKYGSLTKAVAAAGLSSRRVKRRA